MTYSTKEVILLQILMALSVAFITFALTSEIVRDRYESEAVKRGYADWKPNGSHNVFIWRNP